MLLIGTPQMLQNTPTDLDLHVTLLGKELHLAVSAKDLGVYMDAMLSFDEHITSVTSSCLSSLSQINRVKHLPLTPNPYITLYLYPCFPDATYSSLVHRWTVIT